MPGHDLPSSRTERFAQAFDTSWTRVGEDLVSDTPECRESNYCHRIALARRPTDWEAKFRLWRDTHAGKGIKTAWVDLELDELAPEAPDLPPGLKLELNTVGRFDGPAEPPRPPADDYDLRLIEPDEWEALHTAAVAINEWENDDAGKRYLDCVIVGRQRQLAAATADHRDRHPGEPVWISVDPEGPAAGIYRRRGFRQHTTTWSVSCPAPRDEAQILTLTAAFEAGTLPVADWHHREHVTVAVQLLREADLDVPSAMDRMRTDLHQYLAAHGIETTKDAGYHETITRGWLELTARFLRSRPAESLEDAVLGAALHLGNKLQLLDHWSRDCLKSWESRRAWVEPDIRPLD
ncbi:MAG: hypothetical protein GY898_27170 [Proteobacteria bacterium]|nr:hypothetical protein [Pseudomonadota bacterium]